MIKRVYIEITNRCNLRCSFCDFHHREFRDMSLEEFEHVLKEVKPITSFIYLHVQGEPLLHTQFDEILSLCDVYEMKVQLVTNGFYLDRFKYHSCIRKVSISLHSIDEQSLKPNDYIKKVVDFINLYHSKFYIDLRFWLYSSLKEKSLYCLSYLKSHYTFEETKKKDSYRICENTFVSFGEEFEWPNTSKNEVRDGTCLGAKSMLAILSNGQVSICCLDAHGKIDLGNVFDQSLSSIIEGSLYQSILKGFQNNKCVMSLCQKCTYRNQFN